MIFGSILYNCMYVYGQIETIIKLIEIIPYIMYESRASIQNNTSILYSRKAV